MLGRVRRSGRGSMAEQQRYRVIERLASGGMAEVFLAESAGIEGFKKQVAIKRVLPHLSEKKQFIAMFLDEARLSAHLSHSNVVQVFDIGVGDNAYFIVMEYVDGADLDRLLRIVERSRERSLGALLSEDVVLLGREQRPPLLLGALDLLDHLSRLDDNGRHGDELGRRSSHDEKMEDLVEADRRRERVRPVECVHRCADRVEEPADGDEDECHDARAVDELRDRDADPPHGHVEDRRNPFRRVDPDEIEQETKCGPSPDAGKDDAARSAAECEECERRVRARDKEEDGRVVEASCPQPPPALFHGISVIQRAGAEHRG